MPSQIQSQESFNIGEVVTAERLNNHVNGATITAGAIYEQSATTSLQGTDDIIINQNGSLHKTTLNDVANLFAINPTIYAPINSPAFTGNPTAVTQDGTDNSTRLATTKWVKDQNYLASANYIIGVNSLTTGTNNNIYLENYQNASGIRINQSGSYVTKAIDIYTTAPSGTGIYVNSSGTSSVAFKALANGSATKGFYSEGTGINFQARTTGYSAYGTYIQNDYGYGSYLVNPSGAMRGSWIVNQGSTEGLYVQNTSSGKGIVVENATGTGVLITNTANGPAMKITNTGTGDSLYLEDTSGDSSPIRVDANGHMGIGVAPDSISGLAVDSSGIKFTNGGTISNIPLSSDGGYYLWHNGVWTSCTVFASGGRNYLTV